MMADQERIVRLLKTAKGQIEGILKMVEEDRYCIDISNQILATESILRKTNKEIIREHLLHCVKDAFQTGEEEKKIDEIISVLDKIAKG
ncbi:MAG: metal-sensing transcriptional repressor [Clostridiales bacterium]|nr:metal-sensing transcriptional repressor [Clostridiales bacterium]